MKSILFTFISVFLCQVSAMAQGALPSGNKLNVTIVIEEESFLQIQGKTNINTFTCEYDEAIPLDTLQVQVIRSGNELILDNAILRVKVGGFNCGNNMMNKDFKELLRNDTHPMIAIRIKKIIPAQNHTGGIALAEFNIAGEKQEYQIPVNVSDQQPEGLYSGNKTINISDFNLEPPKKFMGLVKVEEEIMVNFKLNLKFME